MRFVAAFVILLGLVAGDDELRTLFEQGTPYEQFLEEATRRKAMWDANTEKAEVPEDLLERANSVPGEWKLLAVAVDGCSDSANTIPYLAALVAAVEGLDMRIINSSVGRHLMEAHLTPDGRPATPTVLLLDSDYDEAGAFIERPAPLQEWAIANKDELEAADYMREKFAWYDADLGETTVREVVELMEAAAGGE